MAYDYLGLVNDCNKRLNEVALTTTNFAATTGYYSFVKDSVNTAIRHINQEEYEWPWNHVEEELTLTAGTSRYPFPEDAKTIDMGTFRIKRNDTLGNGTEYLKKLSYEEYLEKYVDQEYDTNTSNRGIPRFIVRAPSRELIVTPEPDKAYELVYEYYRLGYDMELHNDVPTLPEAYRHIIVAGAMGLIYQFRSDTQMAQMAKQDFENGIKYLRSIHINRTDAIRDRRVAY